MQIRSFRGSGEPARVIALSNARDGLGPDPRRALGPAAIRAASTGRTRDRTRPMLQKRQKVLARAPSTRDPKRAYSAYIGGGLIASFSRKTVERSFFRKPRLAPAINNICWRQASHMRRKPFDRQLRVEATRLR